MDGLTQCENVSSAAIHAGPRWYAIHTRARHEKLIDLSLRHGGIDTFLPVVREVHRWSDRRKEITLPLFPCYVFVRILPDSSARLRVLKTPGVLNFVGRPPAEVSTLRSWWSTTAPTMAAARCWRSIFRRCVSCSCLTILASPPPAISPLLFPPDKICFS
jgi:hypothetical protein